SGQRGNPSGPALISPDSLPPSAARKSKAVGSSLMFLRIILRPIATDHPPQCPNDSETSVPAQATQPGGIRRKRPPIGHVDFFLPLIKPHFSIGKTMLARH